MATKTYTNDADFSPISNCSVDSGSVKASLETFAATGSLGLGSFTQDVPAAGDITLGDGSVVMQTVGTRYLNNSTGTLDGVTNMLLNAATDGDFDVYVESPITADENVAAYLMYRIDDTNLIGILVNHSFGLVQMQRFVAGTRTASAAPSYSASTTVGLRLKRVGNVFTSYYRDDGGAWAEVESYTQAYGTGGNIGLAADNNTINTVTFSEFGFLGGYAGTADALLHDSGSFSIDMGEGLQADLSAITTSTTGSFTQQFQVAAAASEVAGSDAATVDGNVLWNGTWLTLAQLQAAIDPAGRYLYLKTRLESASDTGDTFDELTVDSYSPDTTAPTAPSDPIGYYSTDSGASTIDIPLKVDHGTDSGGSGYKGFSIGRYNSGAWEYEQSDDSWAGAEAFAAINIREGTAGAEYLDWLQNQPDTVTQVRFTSWDNAGNNSDRNDVTLQNIDAEAAPATALEPTDAGTGTTWDVVTTTAAEPDAAVYLYDDSDDSLVAVLDTAAETADLTAGVDLYCKIGAAGKALSTRFPAVGGVSVPPLAAASAPDAPILSLASVGDEQVVISVTAGNALDEVSLGQRLTSSGGWTSSVSRTGSGLVTVPSLTNGDRYGWIGQAQRGGLLSPYSNEVFGSPTGDEPLPPVTVFGVNPDWARWIFASVCKHFDDNKGDYPLYIEGQYRNADTPEDFIELRVDGPWGTKVDAKTWRMYTMVNVLIQCNMNDTNFHRIHDMVGYVSSVFTKIQLYKYGTGEDDDQSHFGCLKLIADEKDRERLKISHFGQIRPAMRLMQAAVDGRYEAYLTE